MKVLIADDEAIVLEGLKYIIDWEDLGFSICSQAQNGEEALEKVLNLQPDLVLLDILMPKLTGTEIIQTAREKGFKGHFIILSGYSDFSYAQTAIRYGGDFYLTKPIDEDELENAVITVKKQIDHYRINPQKGSPLDSLFLTYGRQIYRPEEIFRSYLDASSLLDRRFFCEHNQHVLGFEALPSEDARTYHATDEEAQHCSSVLTNYILTQNRRCIEDVLNEMKENLYYCADDIATIKRFLIDIYLQIKQKIAQVYANIQIPFSMNSAIIDSIDSRFYLYEILHYINHNYMDNLKLETLAPLFGYNNAYLGKIFTKKVGESFNSYLDRVRIEQSKVLLEDEPLKVYK